MDQPQPHPYAPAMPDDFAATPPDDERPEAPSERAGRITLEAVVLARAREQVATGQVIDGEAFFAWFDALEQDGNALLPAPIAAPASPSHS